MKKVIITLVAIFVVGAVSFGAWFVLKMKADYDSLIAESPEALITQIETERLKKLREEMRAGLWDINGKHYNEFEELISELGMKKGLEGLAEFYTYKLDSFDWNDLERSKQAVAVAVIRSGILPESDDGIFHLSADGRVGAIFINEEIVGFHQETEKGIFSSLLTVRTEEPAQSKE